MFKLQKIKLMLTLFVSGAIFLASTLALTPPVSAQAHDIGVYSGQFAVEAGLARDCKVASGEVLTKDNCGIVKYIILFVDVLSAIVGIIIVIMIVMGGIQYSASRDNPQATAAAKGRIVNAMLALVIFLFTFAFLQWIVPGGVFS